MNVPYDEIHFKFVRSGGPGGQNLQKVSTKAMLSWNVVQSFFLNEDAKKRFIEKNKNKINNEGVIHLFADAHRDQIINKRDCLKKLEALIIEALKKPKVRKPKKISKSAIAHRLKTKKTQKDKKDIRKKVRLMYTK